ncbi:MAG TPA: Ig-like domain-containing protein [Gemmatimonadota bacterium]|nr:Ig-like domain-containing protein [Gemmatimonadota bacterium]
MKNVIGALRRRASIGDAYTIALSGLLAVSAACEDDDGPTGIDDEVATVELTTPGPVEIEIGSTSQLAFEIRDADGNLIDPDDVDVVFTSSSQTIAMVSAAGLVTPVAPGTATITIGVGTITDTITVNVGPEISSIDIVQTDIDLVSGETATLEVTVLDAAGDPVTDPGLVFTSSDGFVASVNASGVVSAIIAGTATITAEGGGESDSVEVTVFATTSGGISATGSPFVVSIGDEIVINDLFVVRDAGGFIIPDAELVFTSTDETVVTVDATGLLTAVVGAGGTALVTATSPEATGSATMRLTTLSPQNLAMIEIEPAIATVAVGATVDLDVTGEDLIGAPRGDVLAAFASSDVAVATVAPLTGVVTGVAAGTATITATSGLLTAESVITVE